MSYPWQCPDCPRLQLRAPVEADLDSVLAIHADPIAHRFSPGAPMASREAAAALLQDWVQHWQQRGWGYWAIALREAPDEVLGFGGLRHGGAASATAPHLYFRFRPRAWGLGYASEMGLAALQLAFEHLQVPRVQAIVRPANVPSRRTLERLGLHLTGSVADVPGEPASLVYEIQAALYQERAGVAAGAPAPTAFGA